LEDLGGAGADATATREQLVELPLPLVGRPRALRDLRVRPDHLGGGTPHLLVEPAPEQLGGRALGAGRAPLEDLGEAAVAVQLQGLLADPQLGDLLTDDRIAVAPARLRELHQPVERVPQRYMSDEREQVALVR